MYQRDSQREQRAGPPEMPPPWPSDLRKLFILLPLAPGPRMRRSRFQWGVRSPQPQGPPQALPTSMARNQARGPGSAWKGAACLLCQALPRGSCPRPASARGLRHEEPCSPPVPSTCRWLFSFPASLRVLFPPPSSPFGFPSSLPLHWAGPPQCPCYCSPPWNRGRPRS